MPLDPKSTDYIEPGTEVQVAYTDHDLAGKNVTVLSNDDYHGEAIYRVRYTVETFVTRSELRSAKRPDGVWMRIDD